MRFSKALIKRRASLQVYCAALMAIPAASRIANATTGTWAGTTSNNNWDTTNTENWTGGVPSVGGDTAIFATGIGISNAINLDQNLSVGSLYFNGSAATWTLGGSNTLNLTGVNSSAGTAITIYNNSNASISTTISANLTGDLGSKLVIYAGMSNALGQTLILSGNNNFSGGVVDLENGDLVLSNTNALAGISKLELDTNSSNTGNALTFNVSNMNLTCGVQLARKTTINVNGYQETISGVVSGTSTSSFTVSGGISLGELILSNSGNTNSNGYTVASDTRLVVAADNALGNNAGGTTVTVSSGGTLGFQSSTGIAYSTPETISINNTGANDGNLNNGAGGAVGAIENILGNNSFPGPIVCSATTGNINGIGVDAGTLTLTGNISSTVAAPLQKIGSGTLVLAGTNSYNGGTIISGGILSVANDGNLGAATTAITLDGGTLQTTCPITNNRPFTITANNGTVDTAGNADFFSGAFNGSGGLTVVSSTSGGLLTLSSANTYGGSTNVSSGTLRIANSTALGGGFQAGTVGTTVAAGAQLDLNGISPVNELITLNGNGVGGHGALTNSNTSSTAVISNGVATVSITTPGTGYNSSNPATITASSPAAGGTTATAVAAYGLPTNYFKLVGHSSYDTFSSTPSVVISGGGGSGATAVATLNASGGISSVVVTNPGTGYTSQPSITFSGTVMNTGSSGLSSYYAGNSSNFVISAIEITNPGSGYTSSPSFSVTGNGAVAAIESTVVLASASSIGGAGNTTLNGPVTGNFALTKVDAGTLTLNAPGTYSGGTNVSAGTLIVGNTTGSGTGTGPVMVDSGAVLGGTGTITGVVTVNGTIAPGAANTSSASVLTVGAGSILAGTTLLDLTAAGVSDQIVFGTGGTGAANFSGGTLTLANTTGFTYSVGQSFDLFSFGSEIGTFANTLPAPAPGLTWNTSQLYTSGIITIASGSSSASSVWTATQSGSWENTANWQGNVYPTGTSQTATFADSIGSGSATVTLTANETVGVIAFTGTLGGNYTIASNSSGGTSLTLNNGISPADITVNAGLQTINAPLNLANGVIITTTRAGSLAIGGPVTGTGTFTTTPGSSVIVSPTGSIGVPLLVSGSLTFSQASNGSTVLVRTVPSLNIASGSVTVANANSFGTRQLLSVGSLSFSGTTGNWTGKLDLTNNDLDVQYGNLANITNQAAQGLSNLSGGIISSAAAADSTHLMMLGVIQNSLDQNGGSALKASFDGVAVANTDVLVKYTYYGDTDLNGVVDGSDYSRIDSGFLSQATGWFNGDFNYDGVINGTDYTLIDNAFNTQGAALNALIASPQAVATAQIAGLGGGTSAVPEPTAIALLGIGATGLLSRRRRRN